MASAAPTIRPLSCWKSILRSRPPRQPTTRCLSTAVSGLPRRSPPSPHLLARNPDSFLYTPKQMRTYPPPPSTRKLCPEPIKALHAAQLTVLDPTGARTRLFSRTNPDAARVGDVLLVRFKSPSSSSASAPNTASSVAGINPLLVSATNPSANESYAGVCLNIRRRGVDTGILLRNHFTRTGVEMWVKVYSPNVAGIEVAQRKERKARRARLYYMRKPKHDRGNVQNVVTQYLRTRSLIKSGNVAGRDVGSGRKKSKKR